MTLAKATPPSSVSTACRRAAPTARMVACGGLMMAESAHAGHAEIGDRGRAALVFVRLELPGAGARGRLPHLVRDRRERFRLSARRITGVISPPSIATAMPISQCPKRRIQILRPDGVGGRYALQRRRPGLDDEVVDRQLESGIAVPVLGRRRVRFLAQLEEPADRHIRQIEMRNSLLRQLQPRGDGFAHAVERHFRERHVAVQRLDLLRVLTFSERGARRQLRRSMGGSFDVACDDAATRTQGETSPRSTNEPRHLFFFGDLYLEGVTEQVQRSRPAVKLRDVLVKKPMYADPEELEATDGKYRVTPYLALSEDQIDLLLAYLIERK